MTKYVKPPTQELRQRLTREQFLVTQEEATEPPFRNAFWDHKDAGLYVDIVSGEPLFTSLDKFDSGCGWPSFTKPVAERNVATRLDHQLARERTEVRSASADSHLGHVFDDGPEPTGLRYCINSAALRFIPVAQLAAEGYSDYLPLFGGSVSQTAKTKTEVAVLAGGCFWGVEELFREHQGVLKTRVGYTGGSLANPTYETVKTGRTGHAEALEITFDPSRLSYEDLLRFFFRLHDPSTKNRQGNDVGSQYRSAIFFADEAQKASAAKVIAEVDEAHKWPGKIVTEVVPASAFYSAEDYHQKYLEKNPGGYTCHFVRK